MPPIKGKMFQYSETEMEQAIQDVSNGLPVAAVAKKYGIPRTTLLYKVKGKTPRKRRMGPDSYLSDNDENLLVTWILGMAKAGFPVTNNQLLDSVQKLVTEKKIKTPFTNNRPGRHWYESFLKRHPQISLRMSQNLTSSRASVTKENLKNWFREVEMYLKDNGLENILDDPQRVFNCDETAFFLNPKGSKVLAGKGDKTVYQQINPDEKECLTVLLTGNASGHIPPPMVIFHYERIPKELALSVPDSWGIGKSENGWMTGETFFEFIANIFTPWIVENNITTPILLFIDGHTSHLTLHTSRLCAEKGIILIALYPNATNLLQPMDVAVFRSLKGAWKTAVHDWRLQNLHSPILRKIQFCPLLKKVLDNTLKPSIFENGFRKCGIVPWNPKAVIMSDEAINKQIIAEKEKQLKELETGIAFLEKYIDKENIIQFKNTNIWSGNQEDTSLFLFYKKVTTLYDTTKNGLNLAVEPRRLAEDVNITDQTETLNQTTEEDQTLKETRNLQEDQTGLPGRVQEDQTVNETGHVQEDQIVLPGHVPEDQTVNETGHVQEDQRDLPGHVQEDQTVNETGYLQEDLSVLSGLVQEDQTVNETEHAQEDQTVNETENNILPRTFSVNQSSPSRAVLSISLLNNTDIPTPFKKVLFWPEEKPKTAKKRKSEKVPAVVTSQKWLEYYENKERKKKKLLEERKRKAEERKKNKELKEATKKAKLETKKKKQKSKETKRVLFDSSTSEEEWEASGRSTDDADSPREFSDDSNTNENNDSNTNENNDCNTNENIKEGDYMLVEFPGRKKSYRYVCTLQSLVDNEYEVVAMNSCDDTKTLFRLNENDVSTISFSQIITSLPFPKIIVAGDRIKYKFPHPINIHE